MKKNLFTLIFILVFSTGLLFAQQAGGNIDFEKLIALDDTIKISDVINDAVNHNGDINTYLYGVAYIDPNGSNPCMWMSKEVGIKLKINKKISAIGLYCYVGVNALKKANPGFKAITLKAYIGKQEIGKLVVSTTYDDEWIIPIQKIQKYVKDGIADITIIADYSFNPKVIKIGNEDKECSYNLKEIILIK